jgi:hypothetical protein
MTMVPYSGRASVPAYGSVVTNLRDRTITGEVSNHEALHDYYTDNESIVHTDPVIRTLLRYLGNKLFGAGVQFMLGRKILKPPEELDTSVFVPFGFECLNFIVAHGFLVMYVEDADDSGSDGPVLNPGTPKVPEWADIRVDIIKDERTQRTVITAEWCDKAHKEQLWTYNTGNPFGITQTAQGAPIDVVKDLLRQYYHNLETHTANKDMNSRPPIILQAPDMTREATSLTNDLGSYEAELERSLTRNLHSVGMDNLNLERIRRAAGQTYSPVTSASGSHPMPWWARVRERAAAPPQTRYMYIPHGLKYVNGQQQLLDGNFSKEQSEILQSIYNAFGIPYSAILTTGTMQSTTSVELHKTMLVDTLRVWYGIFKTVLTDAYRLMYDAKGVPISVDSGDGERPEPVAPPKGGKTRQLFVTVHLMASFITTPEQAFALYHEGCISWETYQEMRLESLGLPASLADKSCPPAARTLAQTQAQMMQMNKPATTPGKKPK